MWVLNCRGCDVHVYFQRQSINFINVYFLKASTALSAATTLHTLWTPTPPTPADCPSLTSAATAAAITTATQLALLSVRTDSRWARSRRRRLSSRTSGRATTTNTRYCKRCEPSWRKTTVMRTMNPQSNVERRVFILI